MKTLLYLLLLWPWLAFGQMTIRSPFYAAALQGTAAGGGECNMLKDSAVTTNALFGFAVGSQSGRDIVATPFTAASSYTLCKTEFLLTKAGSPTGILTPQIWSDSSGVPGSLLAQGTGISASTVSTSTNWVSMDFGGYSITNGTKYWLAISNSAISFPNNVVWYVDDSYVANALQRATNGLVWTSLGNAVARFKNYSQ